VASAAERLLYLDASALVKLVVAERESAALAAATAGSRLVSSELVLAEVPRAVRAAGGQHVPLEGLMRGLDFVVLTRRVLAAAGALEDGFLRTLDAIHVASALEIAADLDGFVTYDAAQARAAGLVDLPLLAPA